MSFQGLKRPIPVGSLCPIWDSETVEVNLGAVRYARSLDSLLFLSTQLSLTISQDGPKMNTSQVSISLIPHFVLDELKFIESIRSEK